MLKPNAVWLSFVNSRVVKLCLIKHGLSQFNISSLFCCGGKDSPFPFSRPKNAEDLNSVLEMVDFVGIRTCFSFFLSFFLSLYFYY